MTDYFSRLGEYKPTASEFTVSISSPSGRIAINNDERLFTRRLGTKQYELKDHLGNVTATVSDKVLKVGLPNPLRAEVYTYTAYFPFGMAMPGKSFTSAGFGYRYGFNGKEDDKEIGWQDYGMRMYNTRLARFFSVDPITKDYPELTPFQFASNTPIAGADLDGLEVDIKITKGADGKPVFSATLQNAKDGQVRQIAEKQKIVTSNFVAPPPAKPISYYFEPHPYTTFGDPEGYHNGGKQLFAATILTVGSMGMGSIAGLSFEATVGMKMLAGGFSNAGGQYLSNSISGYKFGADNLLNIDIADIVINAGASALSPNLSTFAKTIGTASLDITVNKGIQGLGGDKSTGDFIIDATLNVGNEKLKSSNNISSTSNFIANTANGSGKSTLSKLLKDKTGIKAGGQ